MYRDAKICTRDNVERIIIFTICLSRKVCKFRVTGVLRLIYCDSYCVLSSEVIGKCMFFLQVVSSWSWVHVVIIFIMLPRSCRKYSCLSVLLFFSFAYKRRVVQDCGTILSAITLPMFSTFFLHEHTVRA